MAFLSKTSKLLGGSLNLSAPGDKIPPGDCVAAQNWRVDSGKGILRSRKREAQLSSGYASLIRSLFVYAAVTGPRRYVGDAVSLWRNGVVIASNLNGAPLGFANYQSKTWVMNQSVAGWDDGSSSSLHSWLPAAPTGAPTVAAGSAGALNGTYQWCVSFATEDEVETNPGPLSSPGLALTNQQANLTAIPVSTDSSIVKRYIYRIGGTQDQIYRVGTLSDNTTTTFTDNTSDLAAADEGITHTEDHDPPPAAAGLGGPYYDKLIAWTTVDHPNRIFWTADLEPSYFPGAALDTGNWADVGADDEAVLNVTFHPNYAIIWKQRSVWRLRGDPNALSGDLERISTTVGLAGPCAVCTRGPLDFALGNEGLYACNGDSVEPVSPQLAPLFKGDAMAWFTGQLPPLPMNQDPGVKSLAVVAQRNGRIYLSYADSGHQLPNTTLLFDPDQQRWTTDDRPFSALFDEGPGLAFAGAIGTAVYDVENADSGTPVALDFVSRFDDAGEPDNEKCYGDVVVENTISGSDALNVYAYLDDGATTLGLGTVTPAGGRWQTFAFGDPASPVRGRNVAIGIAGKVTGLALVHSIALHYDVEQRNALTFDTRPVALFGGALGQVTDIEIEIECSTHLTWTIYSDGATESSDLEAQASASIVGDGLTERRVITIPLGKVLEGRIWRVLITSNVTFQIYALRLNGRKLGCYVAPGGIYQSRELDFGSPRVKLFKKIAIDAEADGNTSLYWSTDQPGGWLLRQTVNWTTSSQRRVQIERFGPNMQGAQAQLSIVPSAPLRLYSIRVWAKVLGESVTSSWAWVPVPVPPSDEVFSWREIPVDRGGQG